MEPSQSVDCQNPLCLLVLRMTGKILSTKWMVLVTDFSHVLLLILLFLLLLKGDPSANDHS